ncbi:fructosamine kinase family protein [soil metagenome]
MALDGLNGHDSLRNFLSETLDYIPHINSTTPVGGGCINTCLKLVTNSGTFFLKYNNADKYPGMMASEAYGLELLRSTQTISIPEVVAQNESGGIDFLVLKWIESAPESTDYWQQFGEQLAAMHHHTSNRFGLEKDNYIGSLPQSNTPTEDGIDFFIEHRLQPQLELALEKKRLPISIITQFEALYAQLPSLLPLEPPALLHGDLWEGNYLTGPDGKAWLVDPSVQYGFREAEIAYTQLFGGFNVDFYNAYNDSFPLLQGFQDRNEIYNLYPLLVHLNLFGGNYGNQVMGILESYS